MTPEKYKRSAIVGNVCRMFVVMAGRTIEGMRPGEIAEAVGTSPANMTRMLALLKQEGFVEETQKKDHWRLAPKLVQIAVSFSAELSRAQTRLDEVKQRYTREIN